MDLVDLIVRTKTQEIKFQKMQRQEALWWVNMWPGQKEATTKFREENKTVCGSAIMRDGKMYSVPFDIVDVVDMIIHERTAE